MVPIRRTPRWPLLATLTTLAAGCPGAETTGGPDPGDPPAGSYRGTLTLAREGAAGGPFEPSQVIDLELASNRTVLRFDGFDARRSATGETTYITRTGSGYSDGTVVVADGRGAAGPSLYLCRQYHRTLNRVCHTPKLSPDGQLVAFGIVDGGGHVCVDQYGQFFADHVVVRDRDGVEVVRFEGYNHPEWLPDGSLLMLGSGCRGAGVWIASGPGDPVRVDGNQVGTQAAMPAVSPDGSRVALVWNGQLWSLSLDGRRELEQLTRSDVAVTAAAWSPDGEALAVLFTDSLLPLRLVWLFRPGDAASQVVVPLSYYPFGPISWN